MLLSRHDIQLYVIGKSTKREKQQQQQMNWLKAALCNTHHNSTIETKIYTEKWVNFHHNEQTQKQIFVSFNFNIEYINEIGLNLCLPLF